MINLFINYFETPDLIRKAEFDYCYKHNVKNKFIDKIFVITSDDKPYYTQFFEIMRKFPNDVNIVSNLDIYFDDTIKLVENMGPKDCYALTRWELWNNKVVFFETRNTLAHAKHSQDVWIFRGFPNFEANFSMGVPGCDNHLAYLIKVHGYKVINPCYSVKCIHVHQSDNRPHHVGQRIRGQFHWVDPIDLPPKV